MVVRQDFLATSSVIDCRLRTPEYRLQRGYARADHAQIHLDGGAQPHGEPLPRHIVRLERRESEVEAEGTRRHDEQADAEEADEARSLLLGQSEF